MIACRLAVQWPFKFLPYKDIWQKGFSLTKSKVLCLAVDFHLGELFEFDLYTCLQPREFAEPSIGLRIIGLGISAAVRDRRHWDYQDNIWA